MADQTPAELLAATDRALKWCAFLLGAMLLILLIDLQLARSIGRQAVLASQKFAAITRMTDSLIEDLARGAGGGRQGMAKTPGRGGDAGVGGPDGMDGDATGTAGTAGAPDPVPSSPRRRPAGTVKRASGDGPGAGGDTGA